MKPFRLLGAGLLIAMTSRGTPGAAQMSVSANAGLFSSYVWRGVTYTNRPVVQPDVSVTVPVKRASLTAGLWANIEPGRYDHFSDISESGGTSGFDVAEVNWLGEIGFPVTKRATLSLGATGYIFPNDDGLTRSENTVELYGRADMAAPLNPTALLAYDVGSVSGAYLEGGISQTFREDGKVPFTLGALAGFSAGQDADFDPAGEPQAESFNFERNGFTHADLWASADVTTSSITISPTLHVIVTGDETTKPSKVEAEPGSGLPRLNRADAKLWLGVTLGWAR